LFAVTNPDPAATPSVLAAFTAFFESLWNPSTNPDGTTVQKAGMSYFYDEAGTLIADTLTGGATTAWGQSARYIYLPTASGPMPVAAIYGTKHYAIQSDHLNTPRRLVQSDGQVAWQWSYSAFGDEQPTTAKNRFANTDLNQSFGSTTVPAVTFNLRYPGQYFDQESGLHYNYHRSYSATTGRYTQSDPIGLDGGWNRYSYVDADPLSDIDPEGLSTIYRDPNSSVTFHSFPGQPAGGNEHARAGEGKNYHIHVRDGSGKEARISTETWKPLTPKDQEIYDKNKAMQKTCNSLTDGQKKFFDKVNRQVFHKGGPTVNQLMKLGAMRGDPRFTTVAVPKGQE
jgi:RHS repeat-associated protein